MFCLLPRGGRWLRPTGADGEGCSPADAAFCYKTLSVSHTLDSSPEGRAFCYAAKLAVSTKPSPLGGGGTAQAVTERVALPADAAFCYRTLSVSHPLDSSPEGRAFCYAAKLAVSTKTSPLGGGGTAQAVTERVFPFTAAGTYCLHPLGQAPSRGRRMSAARGGAFCR